MGVIGTVKYFFSKKDSYYRLLLNDSGFDVVKDEKVIGRVDWMQVKKIEAFKQDLFSYDLLCMEFTLLNEEIIEVNEDVDNFELMINDMNKYCCVDDEWKNKVIDGAFLPNNFSVYDKSGQTKKR